MDRLEEIFTMQKALNMDIRARRNLQGISHEEWVQKQALALYVEMGEMLGEINYKWWKNPKEVDTAAVQEELVDVLHFYLSMCLEMGMTADDLYRIYMEKNRENFLRQQGKSQKKGYDVREMQQ